MTFYSRFLAAMCILFTVSSAVLLLLSLVQAVRGRRRRAAVYLGLTLVAGVVAAGFFFVRRLV